MEEVLVSVIIPAYNHGRYVEETIRSVMAQTWRNLELLVIDDGSSDHTWELLQKLKPKCEERFARVFFERQKNQGICVTMNRLIGESSGKYLFDIASDDVIACENAIEIEVRFLEQHPDYVLAVGNNAIIDEQFQRISWSLEQKKAALNDQETFSDVSSFFCRERKSCMNPENFGTYETLMYGNYIPNGYSIRRSALYSEAPFTRKAPLEDWFLMLQLSKAGKMKYFDQILYCYRWHSCNTAKKKFRMELMEYRTWVYENKLLKQKRKTDFLSLAKRVRHLHPLEYRVRCFLHPFAESIRKLIGCRH